MLCVDGALIAGIVCYTLCAIGGLALVKFLNYHFCFHSWIAVALLSRATWILSALFHYCYLTQVEQIHYHLSWKQCRIYFSMSVFLAIIELLNATSMQKLPGSLYALLKGSDVAWSMLLSHCILHKQYNWVQITGVCTVSMGIVAVFLLDNKHMRKKQDSSSASSWSMVGQELAAILSITAALLNALCTVLTEKLLKATLQQEEARMDQNAIMEINQEEQEQEDKKNNSSAFPSKLPPSKLMHSNLYAMTTSFYSWIMMIALGAMTRSFQKIPSLQNHCPQDEGEDEDETTTTTRPASSASKSITIIIIMTICLISIVVSRFGERVTKHWICVHDSAMTFQLVNVFRRMAGVFVMAGLFQEPFSLGMWVGAILASVGFGLHHIGGTQSTQQEGGTTASAQQPTPYSCSILPRGVSFLSSYKAVPVHEEQQESEVELSVQKIHA